ncbi:MAG: NfeD family protein [Planctomycetota bacterium]
MNWSWLSWAYTFSLTVGTGYTVIAFFLGHVGGGHDGGHDTGHGGDGGHDSGDHSLHFPLFSPIAIAIFLTAFGAGGMIGQEVLKDRHPAFSLAIAAVSGVVFAALIASAMAFIFKKTIATSHARESEILGIEAQIAITIPAGGTGKISYEVAGSRFSAPARAMSGSEIPQGTTVVIRERDGQVFIVVAK